MILPESTRRCLAVRRRRTSLSPRSPGKGLESCLDVPTEVEIDYLWDIRPKVFSPRNYAAAFAAGSIDGTGCCCSVSTVADQRSAPTQHYQRTLRGTAIRDVCRSVCWRQQAERLPGKIGSLAMRSADGVSAQPTKCQTDHPDPPAPPAAAAPEPHQHGQRPLQLPIQGSPPALWGSRKPTRFLPLQAVDFQ